MSQSTTKSPYNKGRIAVGAVASAIGLIVIGAATAGGVPLLGLLYGLPWLLGGAFVAGDQIKSGMFGAPAAALAGSYHAIGRGALREADAILDGVAGSPLLWVERIAGLQRAIVAIRRGDLAAAKGKLDEVIALPIGLFARDNAAYQIEAARALRAFVHASLGDHEAAAADVAWVRNKPGAALESLARVSLAEAMSLAKRGERDALRAHIERDRALLIEHCHPRERAIVRAYQRMLKVPTSTVYRRAAAREAEQLDEPPLADWVAKVDPAAVPFVRAPKPAQLAGPPVAALARASTAAFEAVGRAREAAIHAAKKPARLLWMMGGLFGFAAVSGIVALALSADANDHATANVGLPLIAFFFSVLTTFAISAGGIIGGLSLLRRMRPPPPNVRRKLAEAGGSVAVGDLDRATKIADALVDHPHDLAAVQARVVLSAAAERRGDAASTLAITDEALGRLPRLRPRHADALRPELTARRAFALAMLGRVDEASAELETLSRMQYPMLGRDMFVVRLLSLVRPALSKSASLAEAARWVEQGAADLPLGLREELLADLVRATAAPEAAGLGEIARLKDELRSYPQNKRWIEIVAPGLIARFEGAGEEDLARDDERARIEAPRADEHEHEREQLAEEEASEDAQNLARRM